MCLLWKVAGSGVFIRPRTMPITSKYQAYLVSWGKINVSESNKEYDTYRIYQMMFGELFSESESSGCLLSIYYVLGVVWGRGTQKKHLFYLFLTGLTIFWDK